MEKTFETIAELVQDTQFVDSITKSIDGYRTQRLNRPEPKPGYRYKRDWFDRMRDDGQLNTDYFIRNIEAVWNHKSNLPSVIRKVIDSTCTKALYDTHQFYQEIPEPVQEPITEEG